MYIKSGSVHLVFIKTHTNHEPGLNEVKYLPLPNTTRQQVKQRYNDGVDLDKIIDGEIMDSNFYSSFLKIEIRGPIVNRQLRSGFTEVQPGLLSSLGKTSEILLEK